MLCQKEKNAMPTRKRMQCTLSDGPHSRRKHMQLQCTLFDGHMDIVDWVGLGLECTWEMYMHEIQLQYRTE